MIKPLLQEAFLLKTKGYYKHSIETFYKALEIDNNSLELLLEIADCYYLMNETERAINYIEQVLEKNPTHIDSLRLLKKIFVSKEAWEQSIQTAQNIYLITQKDEDLADIMSLLNKVGHYDEILAYEKHDSHPQIMYEKAFAKFMQKDYENALHYIENALKICNEDKEFLLLKGKILFKLNRKSECIALAEMFDEENENPDVCNFIALINQYEQNYKKALEYFSKAIKLAPKHDEYYYNKASTYFKMGDSQAAKHYYNLAISLSPENQNYHFALANLFYSEKQYKRALEELDYDFFEARLLKSIILYDSGYLAIAKKELETLKNEEPENEIICEYTRRIEDELRLS